MVHMRSSGIALALVFTVACSSGDGTSENTCGADCVDGSVTPDSRADTTTAVEDSGGSSFDVPPGEASSCVPTETVEKTCNRVDDDCNGLVDDVDVGKDGICDCLGVLILGGSGSLASSTFEAWLKSKGTTATRRLDSTGAPLAAADLAGIDIVILDRLSRDYAKSEVDALQAFVKDGGSLVSMTGYDWTGADATRPNGIIEGLGARYDIATKLNADITSWDATHPIAKDITTMTFKGGYAITPITGFTTTVVGRGAGSAPAGVAVEVGKGRMFVWGDEWIEYDSEWASLPTVPKFWANIFGWIVQRRCGVKIF